MKKTGVLLNTQSRFPSSVLILTAKPGNLYQHDSHILQEVYIPRGSRAVSAEPSSPPTVEKRIVSGAVLPTLLKSAAHVKSLMSCVTSKTP